MVAKVLRAACITRAAVLRGGAIALLVYSSATNTGLAQSTVQTQTPALTHTTVAGQLDLARLLDLCAQRLKVSIEYDPAPLRTLQVTLRSSAGLSDVELWASTNQLLSQRGFTTVRPPGSDQLTVVKLEEANRQARIEAIVALGVTNGGLVGNADTGQPRAGFRSVPVSASISRGLTVRVFRQARRHCCAMQRLS